MIALYCAAHHAVELRRDRAHCGEPLCAECLVLDDYANLRTEMCRSMEEKTTCEECGNHCYSTAMREAIRGVMRYAGPRMITKHPITAIRYLLKK